jgi:hypothetical protein
MENIADSFNYSEEQRKVLNDLLGALLSEQTTNDYMINLVRTALDYGFYLTDERNN